jgi:hypothetical protein
MCSESLLINRKEPPLIEIVAYQGGETADEAGGEMLVTITELVLEVLGTSDAH